MPLYKVLLCVGMPTLVKQLLNVGGAIGIVMTQLAWQCIPVGFQLDSAELPEQDGHYRLNPDLPVSAKKKPPETWHMAGPSEAKAHYKNHAPRRLAAARGGLTPPGR